MGSLGLGVGLGLLVGAVPALAQEHSLAPPVLKADRYDAGTFVPPAAGAGKRGGPASARINVRYIGFPVDARNAFQFAVSLWESYLASPVTITVEASWVSLDPDVLGSAGPSTIFANFVENARQDTWYPSALAEAVDGSNLNEANPDIVASFNSDFKNWYLGTDGNTPAGTYDFVTVVLHELAHGLGFIGSLTVEDGDDSNGEECANAAEGEGCWGFGDAGFPIIYDRFTEDRNDVKLLNTNVYPNPSQVLGDVLQGRQVFFDGVNTRTGSQDVPVDLYAPSNFEAASSFSHLDEQTYPPGNPNSLMTPNLARAEAIHSLGPIACGMFQDLGWELGPDCASLLSGGLVAFEAEGQGSNVLLTWETTSAAEIDSFWVEQRYFEGDFQVIARLPGTAVGERAYSFLAEDLQPGQYAYRIRQWVDGLDRTSTVTTAFVDVAGDFFLTEVYPNPFVTSAQLDLILDDRQNVVVEVYDLLGQRVAVPYSGILAARQRLRIPLDAGRLSSGLYVVRIRGEFFAATRTAVLAR